METIVQRLKRELGFVIEAVDSCWFYRDRAAIGLKKSYQSYHVKVQVDSRGRKYVWNFFRLLFWLSRL